VLLRTA